MSDPIFTIARQNGSGGREVGRVLAERLGIRCYDQEIIAETARIAGMSIEDVKEKEERSDRTSMFFGGIPAPSPVFTSQSEAIRRLAAEGSCVFVGRCADYVLRDRGDVIRIFIHAPTEARVERSSKRNGISREDAFDRIREKDRERAVYYQRYTGIVWGTVQNYHMSIDTGAIGINNAADLIIEFARMSGYDV